MGDIVSGFMSANASEDAMHAQQSALTDAKAYLNENLDPNLVNQKALTADQQRAQNQLALQKQIDPALAAQRTTSENMLTGQLAGIGNSASDQVAAQAAKEALTPQNPQSIAAKNALIDSALAQLKQGATLPPDVQAQLMQSGLEQTGAVTGAATAQGAGGPILQNILGQAGINLQQQRQTQASNLLTTAGNLDAQRQQILTGLFPKLQAQQMNNINATSSLLQQSNSMVPQAGLSGSDVANVWLQKVGAINSNMNAYGQATAAGINASGQAEAKAWGGVANAGTSLLTGGIGGGG
jgi:hypothetical protein